MDKDEMIEEIRAIIDDRCEAELGQVHAESKGGKVTKTVSTSLIAKDIYNAGYRKVAEDEIVIQKDVFEELSKDYSTINNEAYYCGFSAGVEEAKQGTAREILTTIYNRLRYATFQQKFALKIVKDIANELGIELE